jgi:AbrB family looped-hinge helix DNA binding protein
MSFIKVTSKRQATLPKALCEDLNIVPGDTLMVEKKFIDGEAYWCLKPCHESLPEWFGVLRKYGRGRSHKLEDINKSIERAERSV